MTQFSPVFILASFTIVLATPSCPNGAKPFFGTGRGANEAEARQNANIEVAKELYGSLKLNASDILTQRETDDDIEEIATYLREIKIETQLPNTGDVKDVEYPYKKENGQFVANRYICPDKAANPYLDSLKLINLEFSHKKISLDFCKDLYKTYGPRVMSFEQILERLEQKGKAQIKNYKEIEKECGKMGKGLFLKTDSEASELDKEFTKSLMGIINFKQGACLRGIEVQLVKAKEPNCKKQSMGGFWECSTDVSLEGIDCSGNGKTLTLDGRVSGRANNEERATQGMLSKLRKCDFPKFDAWKKELQPWMEK
jgi:hypothetical protein